MEKNRKLPLLVVDDEPANLQKLRRTFINDFEVFAAGNGEAALDLLRNRQFSAIITDQRMPGISGVDLLRESLQWSPHAVRIILTGYTEVDDLMSAINEGQVHRYITKPWEPFSLRRTVLQDIEHWELKRESQAMSEQLKIAAEVQAQLFPQTRPEIPGLEYTGICRSARSVGGDYYDFLRLLPGKLWIAIGDVSGKGISAALLMANLQGLVRSHAPLHAHSVDDLVASLNRHLLETTDGSKFVTLFYGFLDAEEGLLEYVNAGHCEPLLFRRGSDQPVKLEATGTVVGLFEEASFSRSAQHLGEGDTLLIYTDGITEAENEDGEQFGDERLISLTLRNLECSAMELADRILGSVAEYTGSQFQQDDQALVILRIMA